MTFKQMMMEKLKENVAYKVANDNALIRDIASVIIDELDSTDIAYKLNIRSADVASEIDHSDVLSDIVQHLDLNEIRKAVVDKCDLDEISSRLVSKLPTDFMDELAIQAAREFIAEMK